MVGTKSDEVLILERMLDQRNVVIVRLLAEKLDLKEQLDRSRVRFEAMYHLLDAVVESHEALPPADKEGRK